MNGHNFTPTKILASAFLTTGLLGAAPVRGEAILLSTQEQLSPRIESQLCNHQFKCSKTGFIVYFLPNAKALFIHPDSAQRLKADYTVRFNRDIAMNVYENPSKYFDLTMHNILIHPEGFYARVNRENRYFQKV